MRRLGGVLLGCCLPLMGLAAHLQEAFLQQGRLAQGATASHASPDADTAVRGLSTFWDDQLPTQSIDKVVLTPAQQHQAAVWQLTPKEEKRYVLLMKNRSGHYFQSGTLSPVEVLGINARNHAERRHYATLFAKQEQAKLAKELAWAVVAGEAMRQVNQGLPVLRPFDVTPFSPYHYHAIQLQPHDQLFFFTNRQLSVRHVISVLLTEMKGQPSVQANVYFADHPSRAWLQHWAAKQGLPIDWVATKRLTLNTGKGPFSAIQAKGPLPWLVLVRNGQATRVDLSRF